MSLRIAYVGNFGPPYSTENDVARALEHLGHEVIVLQENGTTFEEVRRQALISDLLLWTGTWAEAQDHTETARTMAECYDRGIPTATYHLDIFNGVSRGGRRWWDEPMFLSEHVFTADGNATAEQWAGFGVKNHHWLPAGVRQEACYFGTPNESYRCDVAFVGASGVDGSYHPDVWPYRAELVANLAEMCERRGWRFANPGGRADLPNWGKIERDDRMNRFYATAKVTVGDSLCLNREGSLYWSDRVYEATGRGGLLIMPRIAALDVPEQFNGALPQYPWGDFDTLEDQIEGWLGQPEHRVWARQQGHEYTRELHTYTHRMTQLLDTLGLKQGEQQR